MATTPPVTIWKGDGGEITPSDSANIDTEAGDDLITEAGDNLIVEDSVFTPLASTVWTVNDSE